MTLSASLLLLCFAGHAPDTAFGAYGPYDPAIPKPETILGYGPGEKHSTFRDQERVVLAIAEKAKARVRLFEYGKKSPNYHRPVPFKDDSGTVFYLLAEDATPVAGEDGVPLLA